MPSLDAVRNIGAAPVCAVSYSCLIWVSETFSTRNGCAWRVKRSINSAHDGLSRATRRHTEYRRPSDRSCPAAARKAHTARLARSESERRSFFHSQYMYEHCSHLACQGCQSVMPPLHSLTCLVQAVCCSLRFCRPVVPCSRFLLSISVSVCRVSSVNAAIACANGSSVAANACAF